MKHMVVGALVMAGALIFTGCMTGYDATYDPHVRPMTVQDVDTLSSQGVSDSLIISQIRSTRSIFHLSTQDIVGLKQAGVSENVIQAMIASANRSNAVSDRRYYYYPDYAYFDLGWNWWGLPYYYPAYYNPVFYGFPHSYYSFGGFHGGFHGGRRHR